MDKKVLIIIPSLEIGGGAERVVSELSKKLKDYYQISLLTFYHKKKSYDYSGDYYSLELDTCFLKKIFILFNIYRKIKQISPDVIISFIDHTNLLLTLTKIFFSLKFPLIISVRTNPKERYKNQNRIQNFLIKRMYNLKVIDSIVTVSNGIKEILSTDYRIDRNKIITIYNGIDSLEVKNQFTEELLYTEIFKNPNIIKFITIGRLTELKGHKYLIQAFSKVSSIVKNSILFIIGSGPLKIDLQNLIDKLNLNEKVILLGLIENPFKYLAKSDIFVFPSLFEGFGIAILEAFASNLPIISTNCEWGPIEILDKGKYGILVNVADSNDLAENMIKLAKDQDLISYYVKKSEERLSDFELNKVTLDWVNLIDTIYDKN